MSIILICGLPGTGKTTIATRLGKELGAIVLSTDKIRKEVIPKPVYSRDEKILVYNIMLLIAKYLNDSQISLILDATFSQQKFRDDAKRRIGASDANFFVVECVCPENVAIERLTKRKDTYSDADVSVYLEMKKIFEPVKSRHITIDTTKTVQDNVREILKAINQ